MIQAAMGMLIWCAEDDCVLYGLAAWCRTVHKDNQPEHREDFHGLALTA